MLSHQPLNLKKLAVAGVFISVDIVYETIGTSLFYIFKENNTRICPK